MSSGNTAPTTEAPTTDNPSTSESTIDPSTDDPTSESESTTDDPTTDDPTIDSETEGDDDADDDGVKDDCDPFPQNPQRPGSVAELGSLYLVGGNGLHRVPVENPNEYAGGMTFVDDDSEAILHLKELAINQCGVLFGANETSMYVCNPANARCWLIVSGLNREPQGLSFGRGDDVGMPGEIPLFGANAKDWYTMDIWGDPYTEGTSYNFNPNFLVSGDLAWMLDVGLIAMVNPGQDYEALDSILLIHPDETDELLLTNIPENVRLRGIAAIGNNLYAVNSNGKIMEFTYTGQELVTTAPDFYAINGVEFFGAASRSM